MTTRLATIAAAVLLALPAAARAASATQPDAAAASADWRAETLPANVIDPDELTYLGAFAVPADRGYLDYPRNFSYGGHGLTYCPDGDPDGEADGHPGSLFGTGHTHGRCIAEFSIPRPVITKDVARLNRAKTLQPFATVTTGTRNLSGKEPTVRIHGLGYLPGPGGQRPGGRLYFNMWRSYTPIKEWSHGCCGAELAQPKTAGMWPLAGHSSFTAVSAVMEIPAEWAKRHCGGRTLGLCGGINGTPGYGTGCGPAVVAVAPWAKTPPPPGTPIQNSVLLKYGTTEQTAIRDVQSADGWHGAAWATRGRDAAILFLGVKDVGRSWYGYAKDATGARVYDNHGERKRGDSKFINERGQPVDKVTSGRGWKSEYPRACLYFYDPADLAAVADGRRQPHQPQPYARLDVSKRMFQPGSGLDGCGYDRAGNLLYSFERMVERDRPVVHVWRIGPKADGPAENHP